MNKSTIKDIQEMMRLISNYSENMPCVVVDGIYSDAMKEAVRALQAAYSLPQTGEIDHDTLEAIKIAYRILSANTSKPLAITPFRSCTQTLKAGDKGELITIIQIMLNSLADRFTNLDSVSVSGDFDEATEAAIRSIQAICGMPQSGIVDKVTWDCLAMLYNDYGGVAG